jgi:hypothetical protein
MKITKQETRPEFIPYELILSVQTKNDEEILKEVYNTISRFSDVIAIRAFGISLRDTINFTQKTE